MSSSLKLGPLPERMKRLLCTGADADVHFLVGEEGGEQELLQAHKTILRIASDVFNAMFRFDDEFPVLAKKRKRTRRSTEVSNNGQVLVPDVGIEAFKTMLDFIYTDNLSGINGKNVIDLLYAAKKYNLPMLVKACVDIRDAILPWKPGICRVLGLDNVLIAFAKARLLDEKDFAGRCLAYIDRNADTLIKSDEFLQIDQQLLSELLGRDQLIVNGEIAIWNAALRWADEQCRQNGLDYSPENRRQMLGSALFQIRFPIIQKDLLKDIASSCVLTSAELVGVLLYHSTPNSFNGGTLSKPYPLRFPIRQRSAKSTGKLTLKIEKFSNFVLRSSVRKSEAVYIGGFQWNTLAHIERESDIKYLALYIQCNAENYASDWSCSCSATYRIFAQKQGKADYTLTLDRTYKSNAQIKGWVGTCTALMHPSNGWYMKEEDTVILSADVTVKE